MRIFIALISIFTMISCSTNVKRKCVKDKCSTKSRKFQINFDKEMSKDEEKVRNTLNRGISNLGTYFGEDDLEFYTSKIPLIIELRTNRSNLVSEGRAVIHTDMKNELYSARLEIFSYSKYKKDSKTSFGKSHDDNTHFKTLIHEYSSALIDLITKTKEKGWDYRSSPQWFMQGYPEYFGIKYTTKANEKFYTSNVHYRSAKTINKRREMPYIRGASKVLYLHKLFGKEKVIQFIKSEVNSFDNAFKQVFKTDTEEFDSKWRIYIVKFL